MRPMLECSSPPKELCSISCIIFRFCPSLAFTSVAAKLLLAIIRPANKETLLNIFMVFLLHYVVDPGYRQHWYPVWPGLAGNCPASSASQIDVADSGIPPVPAYRCAFL